MTSNSLLSVYISAQLCNTGLMCSYIADAAIVSMVSYHAELLFGYMTKSLRTTQESSTAQHSTSIQFFLGIQSN